MSSPQQRRAGAVTRTIRTGIPTAEPLHWDECTPESRMNAVWELTLQCLAWQGNELREPRLRDLLSEFNAHGVEYLVVGAYALAAHGRVRATGDLDVWVRPTSSNASA